MISHVKVPTKIMIKILTEEDYESSTVGVSGKVIHKVRPNDNLFIISRKYYGDETKWNKIYEVNKGTRFLKAKNETKFKKMEKERPDEREMAAKANEKREKKETK